MDKENGFSSVFTIVLFVCVVTTIAVLSYFYLKGHQTLLVTKEQPKETIVVSPTTQQNPANQISSENKETEPVCETLKISNFEIKVSTGDGATNIARKALAQYFNNVTLSELNETILPLNAEENVYAEDFIRKAITFPPLSVNDNVQIPCTVVEKATLTAKAVTVEQKKNLEKYGDKVPEYQIDDIIQKNLDKLYKAAPDLKNYSGVLKIGQ